MNYIDETFTRANLQQIRSFLIDDIEDKNPDTRPYAAQIQEIQKRCLEKLREDCADNEQCEEMISLMTQYIIAVQDVYAEIGLQVGANLAAQCLENRKTGGLENV